MGEEARPLLDDDDVQDQEEQRRQLRETSEGPSVENEEELLAEMFGPPNADGIYGVPGGGDN